MPPSATRRFIGYPVDRMLAAFDDPSKAASAAAGLKGIGIADREITILRGSEGAARLDGSGASNGSIARIRSPPGRDT